MVVACRNVLMILRKGYQLLKAIFYQMKAQKNHAQQFPINSDSSGEISGNNFFKVLVFKSTYSIGLATHYMKAQQAAQIIEFGKYNFF